MLEKYYSAKGTSADGLLTKATNVLKHVCAMAAMVRGVSTPLHQIPSGRSLIDMHNEFILTKWSAAQGFVISLTDTIHPLGAQTRSSKRNSL